MPDLETVALFRYFPQLRGKVPWSLLGQWPTPVQQLNLDVPNGSSQQVWIKREDLASPIYGGNKVRTIEAHTGLAVQQGKERIWSTGAYGSNHATATLLHGPRVGLATGALLFNQPVTATAQANLRAMAATQSDIIALLSPLSLPWAIAKRRWSGDYVMTPGGATPVGALGHVSAALELASQVESGQLPAPQTIFVAVGSTCTSAGLLVGLHLAARIGIGFGPGKAAVPILRPVRVTPWPFTSTAAVTWLARWTVRRLAHLVGDVGLVDKRELSASLRVVGGFLGKGYGQPTVAGALASKVMKDAGGPPLDAVYSGKSAAGLLAIAPQIDGPVLFWATKSSAPLPEATAAQLQRLPRSMRRWLKRTP